MNHVGGTIPSRPPRGDLFTTGLSGCHAPLSNTGSACVSAIKVALATVAFAVVHSAFCSRQVKHAAAQLFGERNRNGLYRAFFNAQAVLTLGVLWTYTRRIPDRELYCVRGRGRWMMYAAQVAGLGYLAASVGAVGLDALSGIKPLRTWLRGDEIVPPECEAQGPRLDEAGNLQVLGPFRWSRHPLNFAPMALLWLMPRMTVKLAAFNAVASLYFYLGSRHEEARLEQVYGEVYSRYQKSGCPFYLPHPPSGAGSPGE